MASSLPNVKAQFFDPQSAGFLSFGRVYFFATGTNDPKPTYTSQDKEVENAHPVILNAAGYADIYLDGTYKVVVKDQNDVEVFTTDPVSDAGSFSTDWVGQNTPTHINSFTFSVDGDSTDIFTNGRYVRVRQDSGEVFGYVESSSFSNQKTTVVIDSEGTLSASMYESSVYVLTTDFVKAINKDFQGKVDDAANQLLDEVSDIKNQTQDFSDKAAASETNAKISKTNAAASETNAAASATSAQASALTAESARDATIIGAEGVYGTTSAGIANTVLTDRFVAIVTVGAVTGWQLFKHDTGDVATPLSGVFPSLETLKTYFNTDDYNDSDYAYAVVDSVGHIAFSVKKDGTFQIGNTEDVESVLNLINTFADSNALVAKFFEDYGAESGYAYAIADADNNLMLCIRKDGKLEVAGYYIARQVDLESLEKRTFGALGTPPLVCWGDSLTEGAGGTPMPSQLSAALGIPVINEGFGSQIAKEIICRQGGASALATVANNLIPTSGSVAVTLDTNLLKYPTSSTLSIKGTIGGIVGTLTKDTSNNYTFLRSTVGDSQIVPPDTQFVVTQSTRNIQNLKLDYGINIFWVGSNDVGTPSIFDVPRLLRLAVEKIKGPDKRFLIFGPINNVAFTSSTQAYTDMRSVIEEIKSDFPANFIDTQSLLVHSYNPAIPQDVTDFGNKVPPSSLRSDNIHLNTSGYAIPANAGSKFIINKGWLL